MRNLEYGNMEYRSDRYIVPYYSFGGGMYDTESADRLSNNEYALGVNLDVVNDGGLVMRNNFILGDTQAIVVDETTSYSSVTVFDTGTSYEILGILNNNLVKVPSNTVLLEGVGNSLASVQYGGVLYLLGNGRLLVYNGEDCLDIDEYYEEELDRLTTEEKERNDLSYIKAGTIISAVQGRLMIAGIPGEPNNVYFSEPFKPWFFDSLDMGDLLYPVHSDNDRVTHLEEYANGLLIFKRNSIYVVTGTIGGTDTQLYRINVPTGTMSPKTIARVDNFLMFLGTDRRVYALYGIDKYKLNVYMISGKVANELKKISEVDRENVIATYYEGVYMLVYHTIDEMTNKIISNGVNLYVLDNVNTAIIENPIWSLYDHIDIKGFIVIPGQALQMYSCNSTRLYKYADSTGDYDFNNESETSDLVPYTVHIKFKEYNMEIPEHMKIFRAGWIQFDTVNKEDFLEFKHNVYIDKRQIYLSYNEDQELNNFYANTGKWSSEGNDVLWDDFYWAGNANPAYYFRINAKGRTVQNEIKFKTHGKKLKILGTSFEIKVKYPERRKFNTGFQRGN